MKILVSQPDPGTEKSPYRDIIDRYGVEIVFRPFIKIEPLDVKDFRSQKINILDHTAVIFTSRTAINHFFSLCEGLHIKVPSSMKYFCVTEAIAVYLQKYTIFRKRKMFFSPAGKMEDLLGIITKHNKERFIIPVSDVNKNNVVKLPGRSKLKYTNAVMYRTVSNDFTEDEAFDYDVLLFFSPAGVSSLLKNFPDYKQGETVIGSFGMATAKAIRDAGLRLDIEAPNPDAPSMATALEQYIKTVVKTGEN